MEENYFHNIKEKYKIQIPTRIVQNLQQENHKYFLRDIKTFYRNRSWSLMGRLNTVKMAILPN